MLSLPSHACGSSKPKYKIKEKYLPGPAGLLTVALHAKFEMSSHLRSSVCDSGGKRLQDMIFLMRRQDLSR